MFKIFTMFKFEIFRKHIVLKYSIENAILMHFKKQICVERGIKLA